MLIKLTHGTVYDPIYCKNGVIEDIFIQDERIVTPPNANTKIDKVYDLTGKVVMAGAIDLHSHMSGGPVNIARLMFPEGYVIDTATNPPTLKRNGGLFLPRDIGYLYAKMGYTAAFEPAILPMQARQTHLEMQDIPIIDKGGYVVLGNEDFLLRLLAESAQQQTINDYVGWILQATQCIGIQVVNPGGINAFKFNQRRLDLDEPHKYYGVTPRQILHTLALAVHQLGIPHPLHVQGCHFGVPGNIKTTLDTLSGIEGIPIHLTHIQFHSYGTEGKRQFSSSAARLAEAINRHINITVDIGQIMFAPTVIISSEASLNSAGYYCHPEVSKWIAMDIECEGGCTAVPFHYRQDNFVNALQWTIGLELFLLINDPWRVFLTTDHPNGADFTTYPHLIRLLMDRNFRNDRLATLHPEVATTSLLKNIHREYSLYDIAVLTRAGVARILGLHDRGHLGKGAIADITVYTNQDNKENMFAVPDYVFKNGELVVKAGKIVKTISGGTHVVRPHFYTGIESKLQDYFTRFHTTSLRNFSITDDEIIRDGQGRLLMHPCKKTI
jgi:formylmethanofuran dehydrogenase subunit A